MAHLLALKLEPAALLALCPTTTVEREVALPAVDVLVLGHERQWRLRRQVCELPEPEPQADRNEEEVHPRKPYDLNPVPESQVDTLKEINKDQQLAITPE